MTIGSRDHARMGQLVLQGGVWDGRPVLPAGWAGRMATPSEHGFVGSPSTIR